MKKDVERYTLRARAKSFSYAFRGMGLFFRTQPNAVLHACVGSVVIALGLYYHISRIDWIALCIAIGMVLIAEAFNTAIEIDINLTSPDFHPFARDTKDVAAAAVLISVFVACSIGLFVFVPYIFA